VKVLNSQRTYLFAIALLVLVYFVAGFYPRTSNTLSGSALHNGAEWIPDQYLHFHSPGIAFTEKAPVWLPRAISTSGLELSLLVRSADTAQYGPARIFALSHNRSRANLVVSQVGSNLSLRMRNPRTALNGTPAHLVKDVFDDLDWHQVDVVINGQVLKIRVDGKVSVATSIPDRPLQNWDIGYRLVLGNEFTGDRPWLGDIRQAVVRVDGRSFDYLSPGALVFPEKLATTSNVVAKLIPFVDSTFSRATVSDWVVNFIGFVPLGWLVIMARKPRPGFLRAIVFAAGVSLIIETGQLLIFTSRVPSTEDLILNTLGAAVGAWLAKRYGLPLKCASQEP